VLSTILAQSTDHYYAINRLLL